MYVSSAFPVVFLIDAFITISLTLLGISGYLKDALLERIFISIVGIVSSDSNPLIIPLTVKFPVVLTFSIFLEYVLGIIARKSLNEDSGFLKLMSMSCPFSTI